MSLYFSPFWVHSPYRFSQFYFFLNLHFPFLLVFQVPFVRIFKWLDVRLDDFIDGIQVARNYLLNFKDGDRARSVEAKRSRADLLTFLHRILFDGETLGALFNPWAIMISTVGTGKTGQQSFRATRYVNERVAASSRLMTLWCRHLEGNFFIFSSLYYYVLLSRVFISFLV